MAEKHVFTVGERVTVIDCPKTRKIVQEFGIGPFEVTSVKERDVWCTCDTYCDRHHDSDCLLHFKNTFIVRAKLSSEATGRFADCFLRPAP